MLDHLLLLSLSLSPPPPSLSTSLPLCSAYPLLHIQWNAIHIFSFFLLVAFHFTVQSVLLRPPCPYFTEHNLIVFLVSYHLTTVTAHSLTHPSRHLDTNSRCITSFFSHTSPSLSFTCICSPSFFLYFPPFSVFSHCFSCVITSRHCSSLSHSLETLIPPRHLSSV